MYLLVSISTQAAGPTHQIHALARCCVHQAPSLHCDSRMRFLKRPETRPSRGTRGARVFKRSDPVFLRFWRSGPFCSLRIFGPVLSFHRSSCNGPKYMKPTFGSVPYQRVKYSNGPLGTRDLAVRSTNLIFRKDRTVLDREQAYIPVVHLQSVQPSISYWIHYNKVVVNAQRA